MTDGMRSHSLHWLMENKEAGRPQPVDLAIEAWKQGQAALKAGDLPAARRWAERAHRLGPDDTQVIFLLGLVLMRERDGQAAEVFRNLVTRSDTLPAHGGLIAALRSSGRNDEAATELATLLQRFAAPADAGFAEAAEALAQVAGRPGWCAANGAGFVRVQAEGKPLFLLDGRPQPLRKSGLGYSLPSRWLMAERLTVMTEAGELLGSPIDLARRRRTEGFVEECEGGLRGWVWLPADPDRSPTLLVESENRGVAPIRVMPAGPAQFPNLDGLTRPLAFQLAAAAIPPRSGLLHVRDASGRDLTGSPVNPALWGESSLAAARLLAEQAPLAAPKPRKPPPPSLIPISALAPVPQRLGPAAKPGRLGPAVVMPVYRGLRETLQSLGRILETVPAGTPVIVVEDASPEPALVEALTALARARRIRLIRHIRNTGFPTSANDGMRAAGGRDIVLVNSDALVPPGWLERLRQAAYAAPNIGSAAPFSNDATILSYPRLDASQPAPDPRSLDRIDRLAAKANGAAIVEIPTSVGFCMYIRRHCLDEAGAFREDLFGQGYGEENDFCLRARHLGWRHVAVPGLFVAHIGGLSFGAAREHLLRRNLGILDRLHPGYDALIAAHIAADPLEPARRRLDLARWKAERRAPSVLLITHDEGGGVERQIAARAAALAAEGLRPIILRPAKDGSCVIELPDARRDVWRRDFPNLRFRLPGQLDALAALLRGDRVRHVELHHQLGHDHAVLDLARRLGVPLDIHLHDYAAICPRVALVNESRRYCGEPDEAQCEICVADLGSRLREPIGVGALRRRTREDMAAARTVVLPAADVATRLRRYVPELQAELRPWEDDAATGFRLRPKLRSASDRRRRVAIIGALGTEKGYDVLLGCARDAARRDLPLEFIIIGYTHDDPRLIDTGRAFVTYRFAPERAIEEIAAQQPDIGFIPSVWPETWCFALSDAWAAGLRVAVFDIGAQAERVRATGRGWVLPLALSSAAINNSLLSLADHPT
jgi:GT2 family glycosyltransferase/glycosyltransferase involved in cell wall biosynthesis